MNRKSDRLSSSLRDGATWSTKETTNPARSLVVSAHLFTACDQLSPPQLPFRSARRRYSYMHAKVEEEKKRGKKMVDGRRRRRSHNILQLSHHLQTRILLPEGVELRVVGPPGGAVGVEGGDVGGRLRLDLGGALEEVDRQTARHVPGDVAVHQPGARVVRLEGDDQPTLGREHGDVAAGRVPGVELGDVGGRVEGLEARGVGVRSAEDQEIVALFEEKVG